MTTVKTNYTVRPYLFFSGQTEEAIQFYRKAVGAEIIMLMRFKDAPPGACPPTTTPGWQEKVMHARIQIGDSTILISDGNPEKKEMEGFSLSLTAPNPDEAKKAFTALSEGGSVIMALDKTFFSPAFGMVKDRFGVVWMVYVEQGA